MLHNKYAAIIQQYLGDYYREIYGRELLKKLPLSQKNIALTLGELEKQGLLKSRKSGSIKYYKLNLDNPIIKDSILIAEASKKINLLEKHIKLGEIFKNDSRIIGIFGSYAKGTEKKDSDIDIFIVGKRLKEDYDKKGKILDLNISIKYFSENTFKKLLKDKNNLCKEIIQNHILVFKTGEFIDLIWRNYYGFN